MKRFETHTSALQRYENKVLEAFNLLLPPPDITISQWADDYRRLSREAAAEVGKWNTDRAPYLRGFMDAICDSSIERVTAMFASQTGKTEAILNTIGYYISYDPAPVMVLQPTLEMATAFSKDRLSPMIRDSKGLDDKMLDNQKRSVTENTILHKAFLGGSITMVGANSPASLAGRPIRVLLADEVDRYPVSAGAEGSPLKLATKRTSNYYNRKIVCTSTPTVKDASVIEALYNESDMRMFHVPCPYCHHYQTLKWSQIKWEKNEPSTTHYVCEQCNALLEEGDKFKMLPYGKWISSNPLVKHHAGFWLNALYSPWVSWEKLVIEWLEASKNREQLRVFINTSLAETWDSAESIDIRTDDMVARLEDYEKIPDHAIVLTAGIDIQDSYAVVVVLGWNEHDESWVIDWQQVLGSPASQEFWDNIDKVLQKEYEREDGIRLQVAAACVDSGYATDATYNFCRKLEHRRVYAIKGHAGPGLPLVGKFSIRGKHHTKLFLLGVDGAKAALYDRIKNIDTFGPGYFHVTKHICTHDFFLQLTAEKLEKKFVKGMMKLQWVKIRPRNEVLDCVIYATAAQKILNPDWNKVRDNVRKQESSIFIPSEKNEEKAPVQQQEQYVVNMTRPRSNKGFVHRW